MTTRLSDDLLTTLPPLLWAWAGLTVLLAAGIGFAAGMIYARFRGHRASRRGNGDFAALFQLVLHSLEAARDACGRLEQLADAALTPEQLERLARSRQGLLEQVGHLMDRNSSRARGRGEAYAALRAKAPQIRWLVTPEDRTSGLPSLAAFEANLEMLLEWGSRFEQTSGLLLIKLDKFDGLRERYGTAAAGNLIKRFARVLCRSVRDGDLICQSACDTFAMLLPATEPAAGERIAASIRDMIRGYHFRCEDDGPEVLVTASLGYTVCRGGDKMDFALNRAAEALSRSQRLGRNQLHVHDGSALLHCLVG